VSERDIEEATALYRELCAAGYSPDAAAQIVDQTFGLTE
jgi:pentatricopeptide repeat protein